ncbi:MAG: glycosyltransferase family 2 protein [Eubacteriales bacterium]|nr:glycosyltransferase family 2 protein [Eubacteriales bacterium]
MSDILVSIITVCYNSEKTIERTILSVLNQTYKNIEYIIVDGLSQDHTLDIVAKHQKDFGDRLKVISEKDNGIYDAMNKGIRNVRGQLVGIINSDDYYESTAVERMVEAMTSDSYQILYGLLRKTHNGVEYQVMMTKHENLENVMIPHPTCFITKKLYTDLGMYNTNYKSCADYDFMLTMKEKPNVRFIPVYQVIATFEETNGMSSKASAHREVLKMKKERKLISNKQFLIGEMKIVLKALISK